MSVALKCPVCCAETRVAFTKHGHDIHDCLACSHRFARAVGAGHLADVYGDDYFFGGGDGYDDYLAEADLLRAQGRRYGTLLAKHMTTGRILDVGSAAGFLQAGLEDAGWRTTGIEPNATMVAHAVQKLGLDASQGSLEDTQIDEAFDAVSLIQVVGHFFDLQKAMQSLTALTRPGGLCLVEYWRRDSLAARSLGRHWHEYSPPSVLHWYTRAGLDRVFADAQFDLVESGAPKKYIASSHAKSLLAYKLAGYPAGKVMAGVVRALPMPKHLRYPAFDLEWRLYRRRGGPS